MARVAHLELELPALVRHPPEQGRRFTSSRTIIFRRTCMPVTVAGGIAQVGFSYLDEAIVLLSIVPTK